ncbi:serine/threonine-protein kinase ULK3-like [Saccostrea echinata]|uniref:serine/threonine-protein kinase ULK3-like n=1 Tax=Saccostrea echinata TaxID=191078 RepID=UPI002A7F0E47|nr:serine/threonine-protein kinase ULK3-like [Saccostrea echinata]
MSRPTSGRPISAKPVPVVVPKLSGYVFTEKLGSGTYATVYKAYRKSGCRQVVAIKCVMKSSLNKASTENLLTEIELLKKLNHENIVRLEDFQWDDQYIYLIMEYCSGGDLSNFIRSKRTLPENILKRFLQQIAKAMQYLHEFNIAHMDLKPQNILLTSHLNPTVKIGDFGFSKHLFQGDELHTLRGSPLYMAPEIICKGKYDSRVDLWSIGVIVYECLFGRAPFASRTFKELENKIWDSKPVEIPYGVNISESCRDLILRLLKRNPEERITFEEFFTHPFVDLEHCASNESLSKAVNIVANAVKKDQNGEYKEAIKLYCDSLEYFVPAIRFEKDEKKKEAIRVKVKDYMNRAEELKKLMKPKRPPPPVNGVKRTISEDPMEELMELCKDNEELTAAMTLIKAADTENSQENYEQALKHYELALSTFIKYLKEEKPGRRKDLIGKLSHGWMDEAEKIKTFLSVREMKTEDTSATEEENEKKFFDNEKCGIQ